MKRIMATLVMFCVAFCLLASPAFAVNNTYELTELGMSIELPSDYVVFTRDTKANDPNFSAYGLTKDELSSLMLEQSIYLNAWDKDATYEIIVTMLDSPFTDYNEFSDTILATLVPSFKSAYADAGITFISSDIYQHSQAKFARINISQLNNGEVVYGLQYNTVYNGKAINITLQSYSGKIDPNKEAIIKKIVDSVHFDTEPQFSRAIIHTKSFPYTDPDSGMRFIVPENWVHSNLNEDREFIDVKFTSTLEEGLCILFSSEDIYESEEFMAEFSAVEKLFLSRDLIGNDIFTKADIAEMSGCGEKDVSIVT